MNARVEDVPAVGQRRSRPSSASTSALADGETLGLVGESGSGKSTLAKAILGIHAADAGRRGHARRRRPSPATSADRAGRQAGHADGVPEPRLGAQPQLDRAPHPEALRARSSPASRASRPTTGWPQLAAAPAALATPPRPEAAPAVGRAEAARRHRPRLRRRPADRRVRRADQRARRVACRPPSSTCWPSCRSGDQHQLPVHHPRPRRRALPRRPHRRDVPRPHHGGGPDRRRLRRARTTPTPRRCCRPCPSVDGETNAAHPPHRRDPVPGRPAERLRVPPPLPSVHRGALRVTEPPIQRGRARPHHPLPHPRRRAPPSCSSATAPDPTEARQ